MNSLSIEQARKLVLVSQGMHQEHEFGQGRTGLNKAIERLSYIQIDTISVVERAHHHTLWNRLKSYSPELLDTALKHRDVFEYWSHAAAYLPMNDFRFSLIKKRAYLNGESHWYQKDAKQMRYVLDRIGAEGELQAKDFDQPRRDSGHAWGGHKPAKMALEQLFMQGELMVSRRNGFQKVFDLRERVLPEGIDQSLPNELEYYDYLIMRFLEANGMGTAAEIAYLRKGLNPKIQARCQSLVEDQRLEAVEVVGKLYFAPVDFEEKLKQRLSRSKVKILSPFDNLLIQRQRMRDLFDFDYQIECYVTAKKRKYGYFVLPILGGQEFIGRMDAKIDRKTKLLTVSKLFFETDKHQAHQPELDKALANFLSFNQGNSVQVNQTVVSVNL